VRAFSFLALLALMTFTTWSALSYRDAAEVEALGRDLELAATGVE